jgi:hypothetical protein
MRHLPTRLLALACTLSGVAMAQTTVFNTDFGSLPAEVAPGTALLTGVQGFAGLGPIGDQFGGTFLRSATGNPVTIQLTGLPPHNAIGLDFLFAAIDSLDGTGSFPQGDFFAITIDGNTFFRESFANASPNQVQSYVSPPGVELARHQDLGFTGPGSYYTDSAYWLGGDPLFQHIGHTAASLTIVLQIEGPGIQPLGDESWAMDNLSITVFTVTNPGSATAYGTSCGPQLSVFSLPTVGQAMSVFEQDLPAGTLLTGLGIGLSATVAGGTPLPYALDAIGATGCSVWIDAVIASDMPLLLQGTAGTAALDVPLAVAFAGLTFHLQAWGYAPGSNPLGLVFSNGVRVVLGS